VLHAKFAKKDTICTPQHKFVELYLCNGGMYRKSGKKHVKQQYVLHMS